jgi:predicted 3-demethylubiquinone-9 3-methyltransferase (glyoxalase superfamily)
MQKITPYLWFDHQAEDAVNFYTSIFKDSRVGETSRYPEGVPGMGGQLMTASFYLNGQEFMALNGGPMHQFSEAISLMVHCEDQAEVDYYWERLTANGGEEGQCGWLKDQFGVSWQVIPNQLGQLLGNPDPAKAQRAVQAMLQMKKIDIKALEEA